MRTKEEIRAAMDADGAETPVRIEVQRWGELWIRVPSVGEVEESISEDAELEDGDKRQLSRTAARLICTESGERVYDHNDEADIALLKKRRFYDLQRVLQVGREQQGN